MKILSIFPHPDDETIFAGGTIFRHIVAGDEVVWLCVSYGERSGETKNRSPKIFYRMFYLAGKFPMLLVLQEITIHWLGIFRKRNMKLATIRRSEAEKVASILGIKKLVFLETPDMLLGWHEKNLIRKIIGQIEEIKPDIIYTFHPNGITGHPDHVALSKCVTQAVKNIKTGKPKISYATFPKELSKKYGLPLLGVHNDDIFDKIHLLPVEIEKKREAINIYESQSYLWKIFFEKHPELLETEYFVEAI